MINDFHEEEKNALNYGMEGYYFVMFDGSTMANVDKSRT